MIYTVARKTGQLRPVSVALQPRIALRSLGEVIATWTFITALFHIPIANVSAIMQALPLAITVGAMLLLPRARRLAAAHRGDDRLCRRDGDRAAGPDGFSVYSLYALAAVAACVLRDLMTRKMSARSPRCSWRW